MKKAPSDEGAGSGYKPLTEGEKNIRVIRVRPHGE